jgi:hypothetical protein
LRSYQKERIRFLDGLCEVIQRCGDVSSLVIEPLECGQFFVTSALRALNRRLQHPNRLIVDPKPSLPPCANEKRAGSVKRYGARSNECRCVLSTYVARVPTSMKPVGGIVASWGVEEWRRSPLAYWT